MVTAPILLFAAGVLIDIAWTLAVRAVSESRALAAGVYAALLNGVALGATWYVVEEQSLACLLAYAIGGGLASGWVVKQSRPRVRLSGRPSPRTPSSRLPASATTPPTP